MHYVWVSINNFTSFIVYLEVDNENDYSNKDILLLGLLIFFSTLLFHFAYLAFLQFIGCAYPQKLN